MLTWRLWGALRHPPLNHPLFQRMKAQPLIWLPHIKLPPRVIEIINFLQPILRVGAVIAAPFALPLVSNFYGLLLAYNITSTLDRERAQATYDLLAVTPDGKSRITWLVCVGCVHRFKTIEVINFLRVFSLVVTLVIGFSTTFVYERLTSPFYVVALIYALDVDALQSVILGCLCGILAQVTHQTPTDTRWWAVGVCALLQIVVMYLPTALMITLLWNVYTHESLPLLVELGLLTLCLVLFVTVREILIRFIWRTLEQRLA